MALINYVRVGKREARGRVIQSEVLRNSHMRARRGSRENAGKFTNKYLNFYILNIDFAAGKGILDALLSMMYDAGEKSSAYEN